MLLRLAEQPLLLALRSTRREALHRVGIVPHRLALLPPASQPHAERGWGMLPELDSSPLVDFTAIAPNLVTLLLADLLTFQHQRGLAPFLLVPRDCRRTQRLIAASRLTCVVAPADMPIVVAYWAGVPAYFFAKQAQGQQLWIAIAPPTQPDLDARLVPLLAALCQTADLDQAARWCQLDRVTAYKLLHESCRALGVAAAWRHDQQWPWLIYDALTE